ncbi:WD40-repeat-containing domain protein [Aspergillus pseudonomiae]|uniref:WD40-repeat-containing domain protein n=1 Tax=Aspergillus pseudonomiae TaxID=1506151 RepID=A0A5N7DPI7_9EURO|nr:WD40-repeat-containing domain protein [Aspergillus pseudonomiae]KAE8407388.1 WD40-repeat-containing domain protein [Aspergillus pseudonomiae]
MNPARAYEQLVSDIFLGRPTNSSACAEPIHGPRRDTDNTPWTEDQLQHIIQKGLERVNASQKRIDSTSEVFGVVQNLKPIFNAVLSNTPHTALPWAIVSSTIDILANPVRSTKALYDGVNHVVDRMQWYSKITDSLLQNGSNNSHRKLEEVRKQLETGMLGMYKCMLFYEIKSVCFYHKSQVAVFVRGLLNVDDWDGSLAIITEQENALRSDLQQYKLEQILTILDQMAINNKTRDGADDEYRQCLKSLGVVNPMLRTKDIIARKNEVLKDCYKWVFQTKAYQDFIEWQFKDMPNLLWIQGQAGTGKTMLLAGIMEELNTTLANSVSPTTLHFFFQDKDGQVDQSLMAVKSLLWLLLSQYPYLVQYVHQEAQSSQGNLFDGEYAFTVTCDLINTMLQDDKIDPVIVILDGLDECEYKARTRLINFLGSLLQLNSVGNVRVKVLISSRPLEEIKTAVNGIKSTIPRATLAVDNISLEGPITAFIEWNIDRLEESTEDKTLLLTIRRELRKRASNTFLWVSLVCQELNHYGLHMWENILGEIPDGLVELYDKLLAMLEGSKYKRHVQTCKMVLTISILARRPLSLGELALLAQIGEGMIRSIVHDCRSFLIIQGDTVYLFHQSVQDYLQDNYCRLQDKPCEYIHRSIFSLSLKTMEDKLQRNMYKLPYSGSTIDESRLPDPDPLRAIRYSCRFWVHHLKHSDSMYDASEMIYSFFRKHFLHWLEAMSLMHMVPGSIRMMDDLKPLTTSHFMLHDFLQDAKRFTLKNQAIASTAPLQLYSSGLLFSPQSSVIRRKFEKEIPAWIIRRPSVEMQWDAVLQSLDHPAAVRFACFSPDGRFLASSSWDDSYYSVINVYDSNTGELKQKLKFSNGLSSLAFSPDSQHLAATCWDNWIRVWDTVTWTESEISLQYERSLVGFTSRSELLVATAGFSTLSIWDISASTSYPKIKIDTEAEIGTVILSPDFQLLAHTRRDKTIKIWRSSTGALIQTLVDHLGSIEGVLAFSPGNDMLASGSRNSLRLWKIAAQEPVFAFPYSGSVKAVAFSRDGSLVASGGSDCMIRLWNTREGHLEHILQGHGSIPICLSFSVDDQVLASGSQDLTLKLWDLTQGTRDPARDSEQIQPQQVNSQPDMIATIDISPDEQQVAAGSWGGVVTLWDLKTGKLQYTLKHTRSCTHVVFTPDSQQVVWGGFDKGNHVCNAKSGSYEGETVARPALLRLERESSTRKPEVLFENGWVVAASSGQRILWLPPEYRPTYWVDWKCIEHGNMLICGTDTGHIHLYEFQMEGDLT